jgi:hypothetical protein
VGVLVEVEVGDLGVPEALRQRLAGGEADQLVVAEPLVVRPWRRHNRRLQLVVPLGGLLDGEDDPAAVALPERPVLADDGLALAVPARPGGRRVDDVVLEPRLDAHVDTVLGIPGAVGEPDVLDPRRALDRDDVAPAAAGEVVEAPLPLHHQVRAHERAKAGAVILGRLQGGLLDLALALVAAAPPGGQLHTGHDRADDEHDNDQRDEDRQAGDVEGAPAAHAASPTPTTTAAAEAGASAGGAGERGVDDREEQDRGEPYRSDRALHALVVARQRFAPGGRESCVSGAAYPWSMLRWRRHPRREAPRRPGLLAVAYAHHQVEAEMLVDILRQHGIPGLYRRTMGVDVPEFQVAGARVILVPVERAVEARALLDSIEAGGEDDDAASSGG